MLCLALLRARIVFIHTPFLLPDTLQATSQGKTRHWYGSVCVCARQRARTSTPGVSRFPCLLHLRALAKLADILEPIGRQEEAELPAQILAEFVMVCAGWAAGALLGPLRELLGSTDGGRPGRQSQPAAHTGNGVPCLCPLSKQDSRKKDKLLCSQLQVVDFLQNFLAQEDVVQELDPLASEDTSREWAPGWDGEVRGCQSGQLFG